ncbi:MAG: Na-K-Cl cotransporter [Balneolaceae bacterium]|nr:Na-K-Cl cotransporter [Balneolaceae bacterium]
MGNSSSGKPEHVVQASKDGLGAFGGVFTPSILTILGVIMYLRFGWVVGNVGLLGSLLIVTLATGITLLTAFSIAAIATDQRVRIGGAYYMISRSLGIESGGAVGIPLYIAQALSVSLYTIGFAESVVGVFPALDITWVGVITTVVVAAVALVSARAAIRAQYVIMFAIALSLISLIFGSPVESTTIELWGAADRNSEPFWSVFAVFFPAVTGIMAGVNMSGDLRDPNRSIPRGTFAAIGVGYVIYMGLIVLLAMRADALSLIEDPLIMRKIAYWGDSILLGIWGATLSSAVGSILGAPRVLQALARDKILPDFMKFLGKGSGPDDTPRYGTVFTLCIALVAVWFGNLNLIAPILSMFFLTTYGVINAAAGIETLLDSPSFRPKFKVHWGFSLLGAVGCVAVMVLINLSATVVAALFVLMIYLWLERRQMKSVWGDLNRGIWMAVIREALMHIGTDFEPKSWRPHPIVLSGAPRKRWHLIDFASSITQNRGMLTVATIVTDEDFDETRLENMTDHIQEFLRKRSIHSLVKVNAASDPFEGSLNLVESYGLGKLVPNTIILGASENPGVRDRYCDMISELYRKKRNLILIRDNGEEEVYGNKGRIDLWWGGLKGNGGLMMILAYLLQESIPWRNAVVRVKMILDDGEADEDVRRNLRRIINTIRIDAEIDIIHQQGRTFSRILHDSSSDADLILLGMAAPGDDFRAYYENLQGMTRDLPTTAMVLAGQEISFGEVLIQKDTMTG